MMLILYWLDWEMAECKPKNQKGYPDIQTIMSHPEIQLDPTFGWTFVDVVSKGQDKFKSTFIDYLSDDQKTS